MATAADRRRPRGGARRNDGARATGPLEPGEWRALAILGLPTFALAITTVTTYLPVIASDFAASTG